MIEEDYILQVRLTDGTHVQVSAPDAWVLLYRWFRQAKRYAGSRMKGREVVYMHREILRRLGEIPPHVDHIDQNTRNNLRSNLRAATCSQNISNGRERKNNKSGANGVHFDSTTNKWRGSVTVARKTKHTPRFVLREDAVKARNQLAKELHGQFYRESQ